MNRTSLLGSLVLGLAACTSGFSFELLDRMLGSSGCGCDTSCCTSSCNSCCKSRCCGKSCCNKGCGCAAAAPSCAAPAVQLLLLLVHACPDVCGSGPHVCGCCPHLCCCSDLRRCS